MTSFGWVVVVLIVVAIAAITGIKPRGTRPVARTSLMVVARVVLVLLALLVAYWVYGRP
jgi:hypothetical protein